MPLHRVIVLIAGLPGTGKSYMSRHIQARCPELHDISIDLIKERIWATRGFLGADDKAHTEVLARQQYFDELDATMHTGCPIITDYPFSKKQRPQLSELCTRHDYRPLTVRLTADFDTLFQRQRQRDLSPERSIAFILNTYHPSLVATPSSPAFSQDGSSAFPASPSDCAGDGSADIPTIPSDRTVDGSSAFPASPSGCAANGSDSIPAPGGAGGEEELAAQRVPERFRGVPPIVDTPEARHNAPGLLTRQIFWERCTTRGYDTFELGPLYELDVTVFNDAATAAAVRWAVETATRLSHFEPAPFTPSSSPSLSPSVTPSAAPSVSVSITPHTSSSTSPGASPSTSPGSSPSTADRTINIQSQAEISAPEVESNTRSTEGGAE